MNRFSPRFRQPRGWLLATAFVLAVGSVPAASMAREIPPPQQAKPVTDYLGVPGPIVFDGTSYRLAWSQQGGAQIKQEYVPAGQTPDRYQSMVVLDVYLTAATPEQLAGALAKMIQDRKAGDPLANQQLLVADEGDQVLLDFLLSQPDGKDSLIIEWNGYRYVRLREDVVAIVAISRRVQGGDAELRPFMEALKERRVKDMEALARLPVPDIQLPDTVKSETGKPE